jgi:hypothetical protein
MTATEYATVLGNNCRVLNFDKAISAKIAENNLLLRDEDFDDFWHGYFHGTATEVQPLVNTAA